MKLKKINNSTARDTKGHIWFKEEHTQAHYTWPRCNKCGNATQISWERYPFSNTPFCETCLEWEE
jgi:hypothetical protein